MNGQEPKSADKRFVKSFGSREHRARALADQMQPLVAVAMKELGRLPVGFWDDPFVGEFFVELTRKLAPLVGGDGGDRKLVEGALRTLGMPTVKAFCDFDEIGLHERVPDLREARETAAAFSETMIHGAAGTEGVPAGTIAPEVVAGGSDDILARRFRALFLDEVARRFPAAP